MPKFITRALSKPAMPCTPHADYDPEAIRDIVSERSHGNVRLQSGRFYTKKDVDEKFARIRKIDFVD